MDRLYSSPPLCPDRFQAFPLACLSNQRFLRHRKASIQRLALFARNDTAARADQIRRFRAGSLKKQEEENSPTSPSKSPSKYNLPLPDSLNRDFEDDLDEPMVRRSKSGTPRGDSGSPSDDDFPFRRRAKISPNEEETSILSGKNKFVIAGIFMLGIGAGIALDSGFNVEPSNVASREVIDRQTPNPDVCLANGMSAMVLDHRLFITFNPFNVYVSQAEVKPGCVLRQSNWFVLESRGLVSSDEVKDCKRNMNTFGFVGDLRQAPEVTCVYHSESAENQFLKDPAKAALGDGFQPKSFNE